MMQITITLNGTKISPEIEPDTLLIDLVRSQGCYSVKRGFPVPCWRRGRTVTA